jgi:hypothetical protein
MSKTDQTASQRHPFGVKKSWHDLIRRQKICIIIQGTLQLALTSWTLWDVRHRDLEKLNGSKRLWTLLAFVQPFGPIAYLLFGRRR